MTADVAVIEVDQKWIEIARSHSDWDWQQVPDHRLPIPRNFVEVRAYYLYVQRGCCHGLADVDWKRAEAQLRQEFRNFLDLWNDDYAEFNASDTNLIPQNGVEPTNRLLAAQCETTLLGGRLEKMSRAGKNNSLSSDHPLAQQGEQRFRKYRDHIGSLTDDERVRYRGKVLAILSETGEIIADADSIELLTAAVAETKHRGSRWRVADGPSGEPATPVSDLQ